ncbi:MAG: TonB-dependent siderophore receptor [Nodularia sp. CChRGM 3473]
MRRWCLSANVRLSFLLSGCLSIIAVSSVWAGEKPNQQDVEQRPITSATTQQKTGLRIPRLSEIERPSTSARMLVQSPAPDQVGEQGTVIEVTGVQANPTEKGVEVILQTTQGKQLQITNRSAENNFIVDIPNAQLRLPSGDGFTFSSQNPIEGISEITVINLDANTIRVTVAGETGLPTVELFDSDEGLIFALTSATTAMQPEVEQPTSEAPPDEPVTQQDDSIELIVTGQQDTDTGYRVPSASTATRTDTPLRDIPQSIQVVPRQVIEDQKITRVGDALQNVSGVTNAGLFNNYLDYVWIRGFSSDLGSYFRDGVKLNNYYIGFGATELGNIERIEVLKGPASILFGAVEPGGVINFITKSPLIDPNYSFTISAGNYSNYRGDIDLTGPLNEQKTILYRLNSSYQNSGSFRDFVDLERISIAPTVSFELSPQTNLRIDTSFSRLNTLADSGIPAVGNRPADVPRNRSIDEPFSRFTYEDFSIGYTLNHKLSDSWSLRNIFRYQSFIVPEFIGPLASSLNENTGELSRFPYSQRVNADSYSVQADAIGKFSTGSIQHQLLIGADYNLTRQDRRFLLGAANTYPSINIFNPVYANQRYETPTNFFRDDVFQGYGFYIQDQVSVSPQLKLLLGGRYDTFIQERTFGDVAPRERIFNQTDSRFTPRVGIVYQPSDTVSLYASYTSSFQPSFANRRNPDSSRFEPITGTQYEVGLKTDFLDKKLSTTLAGFILERQNVITPDPNNPSFSIQTGEQTSKGIELDITGEILPGWNIIASATYLDARVTKDNRIPVGNRLFNAAETSASLWTTYRIQNGDMKGLGFGLGLYYVGDRLGDLANSFVLPSYFRTDAALYYERDNWQAGLNIRNLFDVTYFSGSSGSRTSGITFGEPLTIIGSFSIRF